MKLPRGPGLLIHAAAAFLAVVVLVFLGATGPAGLAADFGVLLPDATRVSVARGTSRLVWYPHHAQLLAPYLEAWDEARLGFPEELPVMDIVWTGILSVAKKEVIELGVRAYGEWEVSVGPVAFTSAAPEAPHRHEFLPGDYPVRITFRGWTQLAHFKLHRKVGRKNVPLANLYPSPAAKEERLARRRLSGLALALAVAGMLLAGGWWRRRIPWRVLRRPLRHAAVALIVVLALGLRFHDRLSAPYHNQTADEYYHAWAGWSLVHGEPPTSWSWDPTYPGAEKKRWFGNEYRIVRPWFDQPPLFSLLAGLVGRACELLGWPAGARGATFFGGPSLLWLRLLPIALAGVSVWLAVRLGARLYSRPVGLAAALLLAATPALVPLHRLLKAESLVAVIAAAVVAAGLAHRARPGRRRLLGLAALCGAALLVKFTAVFVPVLAALLVATGPAGWRRRGVLAVAGGTAAGAAVVLAYAALLDWQLFWAVTRSQASKQLDFLSPARLMLEPTVTDQPFGAGWVWWLWLAALPALMRRARWLAAGLFLYLLVIAASADRVYLYGWYSIPFYPLLVVAAAGELVGTRGRSPARLLFWLLYLGTSLEALTRFQGAPLVGHRWFLGLGGAWLLMDLFRSPWLARVRVPLAWLFLLASLLLNIAAVLYLRVLYPVSP